MTETRPRPRGGKKNTGPRRAPDGGQERPRGGTKKAGDSESQSVLQEPAADHFPVVGIGASAGGLEAMTQLLAHLPSNTGMAYVVVQHLDPNHKSMLRNILARSTPMPVTEVKTGMRVEKDHVYVLPPNFGMELVDGNFKLVPRSTEDGLHMPVDHFLRSPRIDGAVVAILNIDPVKRSLEQASRERHFAEMLVETVRESLILLDNDLRVTTANRAFYTTFQRTPLQTEGKLLYDLPDWEWTSRKLRGLLEEVAAHDARIDDLEIESDSVGFGPRTLLVNARHLRLPGEVQRAVLLAIEDITERKKAEGALRDSEAWLRGLLEAAPDAMVIVDGAGQIVLVNQEAERFLGYERQELLGKPVELLMPSRFQSEHPTLRGGYLADPRTRAMGSGLALYVRRKDGTESPVEISLSPFETKNGTLVTAAIRDITQRKQLEDQVREVQKMESIGQLAGGLAHDFNNILNVISVYTAIIARDPDGVKFSQPVGVIEKAIERGAGVVHQLLTFARKTETEFRPTDVNGVIRDVVSLIGETFPPTVTVVQELAPNLPSVMADANQLHQALLNLCVNSRDAMTKGGSLTIRSSSWSGEDVIQRYSDANAERYLVIEVFDTGVGMNEETRTRIFEPFFTTKASSGGSGLGLPVVYGIVRAHHGFVDVESNPGSGTTVRIFLPVGKRTSGPVQP